ncbi:unnamed protein product [Rotaria sp. Silwood1]|nr:unnamed protein product [Rotaria sp. Silwood1]CAF1570285.1 unnamed protein product [Rotaria sp. Silwood1]CAF1588356.1 unnamed protein product [Rotaria sp. Silwood1]CAF3662059.1 unnamed protein product [Rotaria sp. Silwood1]CAF3672730.1 unnamed protein product [Rotaria sp. Silwood1]
MFHVALEQLHHIDHSDEIYSDDSMLSDYSLLSNKIENNTNEKKFQYLFNFTIYLWILLIIWIIFQMWTSSYYFK